MGIDRLNTDIDRDHMQFRVHLSENDVKKLVSGLCKVVSNDKYWKRRNKKAFVSPHHNLSTAYDAARSKALFSGKFAFGRQMINSTFFDTTEGVQVFQDYSNRMFT